jgi:hypothetical protein
MLKRELWHKAITDDLLEELVIHGEDVGLCLICGCEAYSVEPDARNYKCEACGAEQVFGVEELILEVAA